MMVEIRAFSASLPKPQFKSTPCVLTNIFADKLLNQMQEDTDLRKTMETLRKKHDDWRSEQDASDPTKFPSVTYGPEILALDRCARADVPSRSLYVLIHSTYECSSY
jgi:hypothetical protein